MKSSVIDFFSRENFIFVHCCSTYVSPESFFLSGFSFTNIHDSKDSRLSGGLSL